MDIMPVKPERKAQLEAYARQHGQSAADALDDLLAAHLQSEQQDEPELSPEEWVQRFRAWAHSHDGDNLPILSDEAISRDSMYD